MTDGDLRVLANGSAWTTDLLFPVVLVILQTAIWHWQSSKQQARRNMFFGARVEPDFIASARGESILKSFHLRIWSVALAVILAYLFLLWPRTTRPEDLPKSLLFVFFASMIGNLVNFGLANRRTSREAAGIPEPSSRTADLFGDEDEPNAWLTVVDWLGILVPIAMPLATIFFVTLHWNQFRSNDSPFVALRQLLLMAAFGSFAAGTYFALRFRARSGDWARNPRASRRYRTLLGLVQSSVFSYIIIDGCWLSLMPLLKGGRSGDMNTYFRFSSPAGIGLFFALLAMQLYLKKNFARETSDPMADDCWKWGYFYYNSTDSALIVPSRSGMGYSYNYASREVWLLGGLVLAAMLFTFVSLFAS